MTTTAHTPTPWLRDGMTIYALDETGQVNRFSVRMEGGFIYRPYDRNSLGDRTQDAELEANAAFIVRAVNSIDELAEALRRVAAWKDAVSMIAPELGGLLTAMYAADAALAKLEAA